MRQDEVRTEFGKSAESYAKSIVHAKGASLQRMVAVVQPARPWKVLDIATGAGHTAFAFAPFVRQVIATDITPEMLTQTEKGAAERSLENIRTEYAEAENLHYEDGEFDLVTCRIAPHHFSNVPDFVSEVARVLRPGGLFALVDNVVPEGPAGDYINAFEKLRDRSHGRCLSVKGWLTILEAADLGCVAVESLRKQISFSFWAQRHDLDMQSFLQAMLTLAAGEAREFLSPAEDGDGLVFYLEEGLFVAKKRQTNEAT